jgi:hypothetical protein
MGRDSVAAVTDLGLDACPARENPGEWYAYTDTRFHYSQKHSKSFEGWGSTAFPTCALVCVGWFGCGPPCFVNGSAAFLLSFVRLLDRYSHSARRGPPTSPTYLLLRLGARLMAGLPFALCTARANYLSLHAACPVPCGMVWCWVSAFGIKLGPCGPNLIARNSDARSLMWGCVVTYRLIGAS